MKLSSPNKRPLSVLILGSTGSVGAAALDVIRKEGKGTFELAGLAAGGSGRNLARQVAEFRPASVALLDAGAAEYRRHAKPGDPEPRIGEQGILELIRTCGADVVLVGIAGAAAVPAVIESVRHAGRVALANKECLVCAGAAVLEAARDAACELVPVDSEHSAAFRLLRAVGREAARRLVLTASGGPFRGWSEEELDRVTASQATAHPVWAMGSKISVDSASYMNKALELVEAHWLFGLPEDRIGVLVHPQSMVHALVECADGSLFAQLHPPDMRLPIRYALLGPEGEEGRPGPFDLGMLGSLEFAAPEPRALRALALGRRAIREGGTAGAVLNAANEVAVESFLAGNLPFTGIVPLVEKVYDSTRKRPDQALAEVLRADAEARQEARRCLPLSTR